MAGLSGDLWRLGDFILSLAGDFRSLTGDPLGEVLSIAGDELGQGSIRGLDGDILVGDLFPGGPLDGEPIAALLGDLLGELGQGSKRGLVGDVVLTGDLEKRLGEPPLGSLAVSASKSSLALSSRDCGDSSWRLARSGQQLKSILLIFTIKSQCTKGFSQTPNHVLCQLFSVLCPGTRVTSAIHT